MRPDENWNPIIRESVVAVLSGGGALTPTKGHAAVVFVADPGDPESPRSRRLPGTRERLRRRYWRYEIDTAPRFEILVFDVPAQEETFSFKVGVRLTWRVQDPDAFVRSGLDNVKHVVTGTVGQALRVIGRRHRMELAGRAEEEMTDFLVHKLGDTDNGLRLGLISVTVRLDEPAARYLAARVESQHARTLAEDEHDLLTLRREFAVVQARRAGDQEREQVAHAAQVEQMRADHELALKRQRVDFYRSALRGDNYDVLIMHLIEHPQDVETVIKMLHDGRKDQYDRARAVLQHLIDSDLMNAADAESMRTDAIRLLRQAFDIDPSS